VFSLIGKKDPAPCPSDAKLQKIFWSHIRVGRSHTAAVSNWDTRPSETRSYGLASSSLGTKQESCMFCRTKFEYSTGGGGRRGAAGGLPSALLLNPSLELHHVIVAQCLW